MKIGLFTDTYLPDINGVVTSVVLLKRKLEEKGHEVWVITNHSGIGEVIEKDNIIRLPGVEIKKLYGYKVSQPIHPIYIEDYTSYFLPVYSKVIDKASKLVIEQLSKLVGDDCLRLIAPSKKTKEMLEGYGIKTKIDVIPTGLEIDNFRPNKFSIEEIKNIRNKIGIKENEEMFVYVGRLGTEKSIETLIKGFKEIKTNNLKSKLIIVGDGPDSNNLKDLTNSLGLEDYCIFLGKKNHDEIALYYNAADCFISASTTETQGITYVEALASGLPLICKKDEVLEDVLIDNKNGYFFNDEKDLTNKIINFINLNNDKKKEFSNASLKIADQYDANLFAENMLKMYEDVIEDFDSEFVIEKINLKDDIVSVYIKNSDTQEKIYVSSDTYLELGLRKGTNLNKSIYERIKKEQEETLAYKGALRKLAVKDHSEREIRDYLYTNYELSINKIDELINKLKTYGFIDDEVYTFNKVNSFKNALYSKKMISRKLKEAGISQEIIDKYVKISNDEELIKAKKLSEKYNLMIHNKSLNSRKQTIIKKLVEKGYSLEIANEAIKYIDFSLFKLEESEVLKNESLKLKKKYSKKYQGRQLRNYVFNSLASKGFEFDKIYAIIDEMEWNDD